MSKAARVGVNASGTLVTVQFSGRITAADMESHGAELESLAGKITPGFTLLTDLSALEAMDPAGIPALSRIMDRLSSFGVGRIIRIIPNREKDIGFNVLSIFHYGAATPINICETLAEATSLLD